MGAFFFDFVSMMSDGKINTIPLHGESKRKFYSSCKGREDTSRGKIRGCPGGYWEIPGCPRAVRRDTRMFRGCWGRYEDAQEEIGKYEDV